MCLILIYYTVCTEKYHESVAVLSRVPQAQVTIRLQTSDVSQYTLYNTFIMFPDPAALGTHRYRGLGNGRGLATVAPHNQRTIQFYEPTNSTASFPGQMGLSVQPEMADHDLVCSWRSRPIVVLCTRAQPRVSWPPPVPPTSIATPSPHLHPL